MNCDDVDVDVGCDELMMDGKGEEKERKGKKKT